MPDRFIREEITSTHTYPEQYRGPRPLLEQIELLQKLFNLSADTALRFVERVLPTLTLSQGAEGWFAIAYWMAVASTYTTAVEQALKIMQVRGILDKRDIDLGPEYLQQHERTVRRFRKLLRDQAGQEILILPAQFGLYHRARSVRRVREIYTEQEFGMGAFAVANMLLTHPDRLADGQSLWVKCPGDKYSPEGDEVFSNTPCFYSYQHTNESGISLCTFSIRCHSVKDGPASGFLTGKSRSSKHP